MLTIIKKSKRLGLLKVYLKLKPTFCVWGVALKRVLIYTIGLVSSLIFVVATI